MQREGANSGESQQTSSSDDGQCPEALRKLVKKEVDNAVRQALPILVDNAVRQALPILVDNAVRQAAKEEIQSALNGGIRNCANEMTVSRERSLQLKFSDEVFRPVLTGEVLLGKTGSPMMVSLIDSTTGEVVDCEPESSAKVEMLLLDANDDDRGSNWSVEDFNNWIISEDDKEKPHLAKNDAKYMYLKNGVGTLCKLKLGHGERWKKNCMCRLAARVVQNFRGNEVKAAVTESFVVLDKRSKLYEKHHPPLLSDEVWRLKNIGKNGAPCQRLNEGNIRTVQDFLFLHNVDPQALQQIFRVRADPNKWKETVDHARRCTIDDEKLYLHQPRAAPEMSVVFDAVGGLKGLVVNQSHYTPIDNLSADEKECAHKLLLSAFKNREERASFDDEASLLLHQFPYRPSDINGCDPMIAGNINHYFPTEPAGSSSLSITPYIMTSDLHNPSMDTNNLSVPIRFPSFQLPDLENINGYAPTYPSSSSQSIYQSGVMDTLLPPPSYQFSYFENINRYDPSGEGTSCQSFNFGFCSPGSPTTGLLRESDIVFETRGDNWSLASLFNPNTNGVSETFRGELHSHDQSRAFRLVGGVAKAILWVVRAKKRKRVIGLGGMPVLKRQMT